MKTKSLLSLLVMAVVLCFNSCKKETVDVTRLLESVPSSAAGVVVFNVESLLGDAGCKVNGHEIQPGEEIRELLKNATSERQQEMMALFNGESGIEPKGAVIFYDSNRSYLTFALSDVKKFCDFFEKKFNASFSDESGVKVLNNIAVKGAQAWICLSQGKRLDPDAVVSYSSLAGSQSFLVSQMGQKLLVQENDIRGWALISTFTNEMLTRSERSMVTLGLGFLFEGAESVEFKVDFEKGEMESEIKVLNDKGKPAKYLLPSEKVDVSTLKTLGTTCDALMAFTVNPKLIKKFQQIGEAFGGALFGDLGEMFKNIDGTVGIISGGQGMGESISGVLTTKGTVSQTILDLISGQIAPVSQDGKYLRFNKGDVKGGLNVADCAEDLDDCCLGLVFDATGYNSVGYGTKAPGGFRDLALKFKPESGGLELEINLHTLNTDENALLTFLKDMK